MVFSTWRPWISDSGLKALAAALATTTSMLPEPVDGLLDERLDGLGLGDVCLDGDRCRRLRPRPLRPSSSAAASSRR